MDQINNKSEQLSSSVATQENINSKDKLKNSIASKLNEEGFNGELIADAVMNYREDGQVNTFSIMALDALPKHIDYNSNPDALGVQYYKLLRSLTQMKLLNADQVNDISAFVYETLGIVEQQQQETGFKAGQNEDFFINELASKNYDAGEIRKAIQKFKSHNNTMDLMSDLMEQVPDEISQNKDPQIVGKELYFLITTLLDSHLVSEEQGKKLFDFVQDSFGKVLEDENEKNEKSLNITFDNETSSKLLQIGVDQESLKQIVSQFNVSKNHKETADKISKLSYFENLDSENKKTFLLHSEKIINILVDAGVFSSQDAQQMKLDLGIDLINLTQKEVDLYNPEIYRVDIKDSIENQFAQQYGFEAIRNATNIINSMARSVGYDGKKLVALFEDTNTTGDQLTDKFVGLYLNSNAKDYLLAATEAEQVSGFINSL